MFKFRQKQMDADKGEEEEGEKVEGNQTALFQGLTTLTLPWHGSIFLIHAADPQIRPVGMIVFAHVRSSVGPFY